MENNKKVVLTYGSFDLFHVGHLNLLERARSLGHYLIVGVSTDEFNTIKGKKSFFNYEDRARIVNSCKFVDKVIPESDWSQKVADIQDYQVDIFVMGDDWKGKFDNLNVNCEVTYIKRTPGISSSQIRMASNKIIESNLLIDLRYAKDALSCVIEKFEGLR